MEEDPDEKNEENELKIQVIYLQFYIQRYSVFKSNQKYAIPKQANALRHEITALENKLAEKEKLASNQVNAIMKV